ncbi:antitoxin Xre-like helix-turn-helix domain-containing protein [Acinetobacter haemolyticus]|uniref:antitoxin Xre-like helix-turn-helix domain-containing protein n=1 Tax=Acinetobacter haemolyticus TaxID=29430 RepID=UPI000DE8EF14|nr:antitoxin Xre-like helix-turn-helix domain-containing protein [Acinetobacter haemolyticus]WHR58746.1 hypothetical protein PGW89_04690 [Acinetobacter haemolyticus]
MLEKKAILGKAVFNAATQLGIDEAKLAAILDINYSALISLKNKQLLDPKSKQGKQALLLIQMVKNLNNLAGGDPQIIHHFMNTPNSMTKGVPLQQLDTPHGLKIVSICINIMSKK